MIPYRYALRRKMMQKQGGIIAQGQCGNNAYWKLDKNGMLIILGTGAMYDGTATWVDYRLQILSVIINNGIANISNSAFDGCSSLTSVTIPDSVTSIGYSAFRYCSSLASVTIPDSVTSIGNSAFRDCSSLVDVYYTGTQQQWDAISIGLYNDPLLNATIHYNYSPT